MSSAVKTFHSGILGYSGETLCVPLKRRVGTSAQEPLCCVSFPHLTLSPHTFSRVARVHSSFLRPGTATDAKQPGQDDKREEHGRERQGDLL